MGPEYCEAIEGEVCKACGATEEGNDLVHGVCQARNSGAPPHNYGITIGMVRRDTGEWI